VTAFRFDPIKIRVPNQTILHKKVLILTKTSLEAETA